MRPKAPAEDAPGMEYLDQLVTGYQGAQVVLTANRMGLFDLLADDSWSSREIAFRWDSDERGTRILCDALVALGLLEKQDGRYRNAGLSQKFLLRGSPESKRNRLVHAALLYERWAGLAEAVRTGRRVPDERIRSGSVASKREFALAMADTGRQIAGATVRSLNLEKATLLLDVGGGPGIYAIEFASRYPALKVVILDDAETLEVARENVEAAALTERIQFLPGDAFEDDWGTRFDFIFLSNLVHIYSPEENSRLLKKCSEALMPGGRVCIKDFILGPDRTSPPSAALFAVNMLVSTEGGDCYTVEEVDSWFRAAGLELEETIALTPQSGLVIGLKPVPD